VIVLDTHIWVWWVSGIERLSSRSNRLIKQAVDKDAVYISSISTWEVAQLVKRGRMRLTIDVSDWIAKSEGLPFVHFVPVDNRIAVKSVQLPEPLHTDPADRIIIATALTLGLTLSLSSLSFALDRTDMYTKPTAKSEVKDEVKDGNVEADFTSFYINPKTASTTTCGRQVRRCFLKRCQLEFPW